VVFRGAKALSRVLLNPRSLDHDADLYKFSRKLAKRFARTAENRASEADFELKECSIAPRKPQDTCPKTSGGGYWPTVAQEARIDVGRRDYPPSRYPG